MLTASEIRRWTRLPERLDHGYLYARTVEMAYEHGRWKTIGPGRRRLRIGVACEHGARDIVIQEDGGESHGNVSGYCVCVFFLLGKQMSRLLSG
ncbi:hypothetical protein LX32DRAFT_277804 [Colletotrichum zoysiae]|uniref:Uncharacterized protein n=1 Tax=Colletotrichum zoysiae TaxID=1216348 RepID=A0AAD9H296_9PEZI|nr:hypothetical protein LX32DRAFT_277804 [Colletotrichum zoysiae]